MPCRSAEVFPSSKVGVEALRLRPHLGDAMLVPWRCGRSFPYGKWKVTVAIFWSMIVGGGGACESWSGWRRYWKAVAGGHLKSPKIHPFIMKPSEAVRSYPSDQYQGSQLHLKNKNTKHGDNETSHRTLEEVLVSVKGDLYRFVIWKYSVPCESLILIMLISWMLWTSPFTSFVCWAEFPYPKQLFSFWDISWHKELLLVRWWLFGG